MDKNHIQKNISTHNKIAAEYENRHGEIFNPIEQNRLREKLAEAVKFTKSGLSVKKALDYGCGTGNLTKYLIDLGFYTVSADVSDNFLRGIKKSFGHTLKSETLLLNGTDLSNVRSGTFDFVGVYSVLHHIPDYAAIVSELARILKSGGVLFIDHENCPAFWNRTKEYTDFIAGMKRPLWKRLLNLFISKWYYIKIRLFINPRWQPEGDIHVFPDDHIEWNALETCLQDAEFEILVKDDYLVYKRHYPLEHYNTYKNKCADMRLVIARKGHISL